MSTLLSFLIALWIMLIGFFYHQKRQRKDQDRFDRMKKQDWDDQDFYMASIKKEVPRTSWFERKNQELKALDIGWDLRKYMTMLGIGVIGGIIFGIWFLKAPFLILLSAILGSRVPQMMVQRTIQKHRDAFDHQYRNALIRLAALTRASASIQHGFWELANSRDTSERIRKEFYLAYTDMNYSKTADEALINMAERTNSEDVRMTALMVKIHRIKGGNLVELLEGIQESISMRTQQQRKMKTMTAQQMSQANLLGMLPLVTFLLFSLANPSYYGDFLQTTTGQIIFIACVGMIFMGRKLMSKIIQG